ncbi:MAG: S8 family peptidase [Fimbriimonadaceae bacterium]|nr:S8 family peptidase [Fimbriimonadaceae bacterium]
MRLGWLGLFVALCCAPCAQAQDYVEGEVLVKFKSSATRQMAALDLVGGQIVRDISGLGVSQVRLDPYVSVSHALYRLRSNPDVEFAEPNYIARAFYTPNDTNFGQQYGPTKMACPSGWDRTKGDPNIVIAIIDTGIDLNHPDLAGKIVAGYDFVNNDTSPMDDHGHGTHCAGIAAAKTDNGMGIAGVGFNCRVMAVKVLDRYGSGAFSDVAEGVIYATDHGAKVISLSLGGSQQSTTLLNAVNYAWSRGVVVCAAAGNTNTSSPSYPAYFSNCIAVGSTTETDAKSGFSNYGSWVDVAAPGSNILSTFPSNRYQVLSGTSMATPAVAGLAGLVWSRLGVGATGAQVRAQIENNCDGVGTWVAKGRVNASRALAAGGSSVTLDSLTTSTASIVGPGSGTGTVVLSGNAPVGGVTVTLSSSQTSALTVPASVNVASGARQATFNFNALAVTSDTNVTITASGAGGSKLAVVQVKRWVPPALSALSLSQSAVTGPATVTGIVSLNVPAAPGGLLVTLSSSNVAASVPSNVVVPAGSTSANFPVNCTAVGSDLTVNLTGTGGGQTRQTTLRIVSAPVAISALSVTPNSTVGGRTPYPTGLITLTAPAPPGGAVVSVTTSNSVALSPPRTVTVPAGQTSKTFQVFTYGVSTNTNVTLSATWRNVTKNASVTVLKR